MHETASRGGGPTLRPGSQHPGEPAPLSDALTWLCDELVAAIEDGAHADADANTAHAALEAAGAGATLEAARTLATAIDDAKRTMRIVAARDALAAAITRRLAERVAIEVPNDPARPAGTAIARVEILAAAASRVTGSLDRAIGAAAKPSLVDRLAHARHEGEPIAGILSEHGADPVRLLGDAAQAGIDGPRRDDLDAGGARAGVAAALDAARDAAPTVAAAFTSADAVVAREWVEHGGPGPTTLLDADETGPARTALIARRLARAAEEPPPPELASQDVERLRETALRY